MAAIASHFNFWNATSEKALRTVWLHDENSKKMSVAVVAVAMIAFPFIVFGNSLVILSVWKDPLKKLRSSPSNFILLSMAIADLLVGFVACPTTVYWHWAVFHSDDRSHLPLLFSATLLIFSVSHIFLLTVDRFFALETPLHYKDKVTNKRVSIAAVACWSYFLLFGCAFGLLQRYYTIMGAIYNIQMFCIVAAILILYVVILCGFHRFSKKTELKDQSAANRQRIFQRERSLWKGIAIVICAFLLCFLPWLISQLITLFCISCHRNLWLLLLSNAFSVSLMYVNSGLNPFLYAWRLPKYRETFKHLMKKRTCCRGSENRRSNENCIHGRRV
ncbi:adenosine receptor A2a-like [Oculina patagonica]